MGDILKWIFHTGISFFHVGCCCFLHLITGCKFPVVFQHGDRAGVIILLCQFFGFFEKCFFVWGSTVGAVLGSFPFLCFFFCLFFFLRCLGSCRLVLRVRCYFGFFGLFFFGFCSFCFRFIRLCILVILCPGDHIVHLNSDRMVSAHKKWRRKHCCQYTCNFFLHNNSSPFL